MATVDHCVYCFDTILAQFYPKHALRPPTFANESFPLFVTWNTRVNDGIDGIRDRQLRGCIGTFSSVSIHDGLKDYAIRSAFHDRRFRPMQHHELPTLELSVSLLTNFEEAKDVYDWNIGKHGIWIDWIENDGVTKRNATYLPDVMPEQGWTKDEALESLIRKAGYRGRITTALKASIRLTRYQSSKYTLAYYKYAHGIHSGSLATYLQPSPQLLLVDVKRGMVCAISLQPITPQHIDNDSDQDSDYEDDDEEDDDDDSDD